MVVREPNGASPQDWDCESLRDPHGDTLKAARVERMFNAIAKTYERVNAIASLGQDARWRRAAVRAADVRPGDVVLDVCCGTGDMIRAFAQGAVQPARVIGVDFAQQMLDCGDYDNVDVDVELIRGDALDLPLADGAVDVVSCAFGVRNFQDLQRGLCEMARVLRPGGRCVILEFATPTHWLPRLICQAYCDWILPRVGAWVSRDTTGAYRYLPRSIRTFETSRSMRNRLEDAGFDAVDIRALNLGSVAIYRATKAD